MSNEINHHGIARKVFIEHNGSGPWPCGMCEGLVLKISRQDGTVHHVDEDQNNNSIINLMMLHKKCHNQHHNQGKKHVRSAEYKAKMSRAKKGLPSPRKGATLSDETKEQIASKLRGRKLSPETRAKMSAARQRDREKIAEKSRRAWAEGRGHNQWG